VSIRAIAAKLGRAPSTISRELRRNTGPGGTYRPFQAHRQAVARRPARTDGVWLTNVTGTTVFTFGPVPEQVSLGDFIIPQRGVLAVGHVFFESFDQARHLSVTSRAREVIRGR
jgi:hypothetical protein